MKKITVLVITMLFAFAIIGCDFNSLTGLLTSLSEQYSTESTSTTVTDTTTSGSGETTTTPTETTTSGPILSVDEQVKVELLEKLAALEAYGVGKRVIETAVFSSTSIIVAGSGDLLMETSMQMNTIIDFDALYLAERIVVGDMATELVIQTHEGVLYMHTLEDGTPISSEVLADPADAAVFQELISTLGWEVEPFSIPELADFQKFSDYEYQVNFPLSLVFDHPDFAELVAVFGFTEAEEAADIGVRLTITFDDSFKSVVMGLAISDVPIPEMAGYAMSLAEFVTLSFPDSYESIDIEPVLPFAEAAIFMDPDSPMFTANEPDTFDTLHFGDAEIFFLQYYLEPGYYVLPFASSIVFNAEGDQLLVDPYFQVTEAGVYFVRVEVPEGIYSFVMADLGVEAVWEDGTIVGEVVDLYDDVTYSFPNVEGPCYLKITPTQLNGPTTLTIAYNSTYMDIVLGESVYVLVKPENPPFIGVQGNILGTFELTVETVLPSQPTTIFEDMPNVVLGETNSTIIFLTPENPSLFYSFVVPETGEYELIYGMILDWNMTGVTFTLSTPDFVPVTSIYPWQALTLEAGTYVLTVSVIDEGYFFVLPWIIPAE